MISESYIYKDELLRIALELRKRGEQKRWVERTFLLTEKSLFYAFFIIRKLIETPKISDSLRSKSYPVVKYRIDSPRDINWTNDHKTLNYIDFDNPIKGSLDLKKICNQFIHSFLLYLVRDEEGKLHDVMVSSDYFKSKECYSIELGIITQILDEVGNNYPATIRWHRDLDTSEIISYEVE
jgi:hypothetical protein